MNIMCESKVCNNFYPFLYEYLGGVWFMILNNHFQFLNNISRISMHFFTHTYFH